MYRTGRPEGLDLPSPQPQKTRPSLSERTPSVSGLSLLSPPSVTPDPAYIAASAASQIVNSDRADRGQVLSEDFGEDGVSETAIVTSGSLSLVNAFLDQLLFSFLAASRSTSIASLRPAILEILKPKLGKEAIDGADEELQGYIAGGDAEELMAFHSGQEFRGDYNLNLIWRKTRLRCMVYTRLGDMEEDDEDMYFEQEEEADVHDGQPRLTRDLGFVSPAAAIFLTSILEFIGEQALLVAGEAAYNRIQLKQPNGASHRAIVEEVDMEKLAFNTTLGRLWRSWKKRVRSSSLLSPRPLSRDTQRSTANSVSSGDSSGRRPSTSENSALGYFNRARQPSFGEVLHEDLEPTPEVQTIPKNLPEEPDFSDFSAGTPSPKASRGRPRSMIDYRKAPSRSPTRTPPQTPLADAQGVTDQEGRPKQKRQRSLSLPAGQTPYVSPVNETFTTPTEGPDPFIRDNDRLQAEQEMPRLTDDSRTFSDGDQATTTMYDGAISHDIEPPLENEAEAEWTNRSSNVQPETSNCPNDYDHEMTPHALRLHKTGAKVNRQPHDSRDSTRSSNYNFIVGELKSGGHPEVLDKRAVDVEIGTDDESSNDSSRGKDGQQPILQSKPLATLQEHQLDAFDKSDSSTKQDGLIPHSAGHYDVESLNEQDANTLPGAKVRDDSEAESWNRADFQTAGNPYGVSTLSPLREFIDGAHDTPNRTSSPMSYEPLNRESFVPAHRYRASGNASVSSATFNQGPPPTSATRSISVRSQSAATSAGTEKAAVQRVSPSTSIPRSTTGRTSTSSNRDGRPMTAGSTTSQMSSKIKGMMGRESGDLVRQPMPKRNSSEGSGSLISTQNKEQDFEDLIKSKETVKYTLTPQNMREMEKRDSPRWQDSTLLEPVELADSLGNITPASAEFDRPATSRSLTKLKGLNGLRSNPINSTSPTTLSSETSRFPPRSVPRSPGPRSPGPIARDPTTKDESVRDFADFIRSTGPGAGPSLVSNPLASNSSSGSRPGSSSSPSTGVGKAAPKKITKQNPVIAPKKSDAQLPRRTPSKLQAREPTVGNTNATADLADFLRSEPVRGQTNTGTSTPRTGPADLRIVTPNGIANGKIKDAIHSGSSVASTQDSFAPSKMTQSSANSRTALLDSSNRAAASSTRDRNQTSARNDDPPGPARKQHRGQDPYSIDSDDENDSGYGTPQPPPQNQEESLSDFLRNYHPPPESTAQRTPPKISGAPKPAKQNSPTIRERITRNIAVVPDNRPIPLKAPKKSPNNSSKSPPQPNEIPPSARRAESARRLVTNQGFSPPNQNNIVRGRSSTNIKENITPNTNTSTAPQLPPLNPRATSPHLVSQNGSKLDSYRPTQPTYAKHVDRGPRRHLQARDDLAGPASSSGMGDLADFLRQTEPPAPSGPVSGARPVSPVKEKKESAFGRMFGRK